jgi:hypothetical protein
MARDRSLIFWRSEKVETPDWPADLSEFMRPDGVA